ncbi:pyrimidine/purine nucleoside phosphorylase [Enterobacter cloacae]|uniref:pyrimidine/purine nucleoside phosphorylase n=1 Tax=Enterobacter cloacae TaxID=550 RepID=UPI0009B51E22|nr:pyrimidine/purine nucleoside phosphorylase [Enterobacter cloacae]
MMSELLRYEKTFIFFDGKVVLRDFSVEGNKMTMGYMASGHYRWLAEDAERFIIVSGNAIFAFNDKEVNAQPGDEVFVPPGTTFTVEVAEPLDYRCYYA